MRRKTVVIAVSVIVAMVAVAVVARHAVLQLCLADGRLSAATGYSVRFGDSQIGWSHATLRDVHVTKNGDPVLDADRVDVDYALRDIFPGGQHRFGFAGDRGRPADDHAWSATSTAAITSNARRTSPAHAAATDQARA